MPTVLSDSVRAVVVTVNTLFLVIWTVGVLILLLQGEGTFFGNGNDLAAAFVMAMVVTVPVSVGANTYALVRPGKISAWLLVTIWIFSVLVVLVTFFMYPAFALPALGPMVWTPIVMIHRWNPTNSP